ncbi:MAG: MBL fold metallo-hydrolase [Granulosicoccus sp.]
MKALPESMLKKPAVEAFFDEATNTISYVVKDPDSAKCVVVDSVMDFDFSSGRTGYAQADRIIDFVRRQELEVAWLIETHVHADHLSAAPYIQDTLGGKIGIGHNITVVQDTFGKLFNEGTQFERDGSQFDALFNDRDTYQVGKMTVNVLETPGHTPACMTHIMGNSAFVGDTLFMPDSGSARADFPGGDAGILFDSIQKILELPDDMILYMCHDYGPNGRDIQWQTTVGEEKRHNIHVGAGKTREDFIRFRTERDSQLAVPRLIIPSLQVNMRAGVVPRDENGNPAIRFPLNSL